MTVLIAGAGIGGLTLALSLHQIGIPVRVFEAVDDIKPLGVGINVQPHAVRELSALGLLDDLDTLGLRTREVSYFSTHGSMIWTEARGTDAGYRWPQISIHRGHLQKLLLRRVRERLGPGSVQTGQRVVGWHDHGDRIEARLESGLMVSGTVLIACDGIHSAARATLWPDEGPPIWNRVLMWRGTTRADPFLSGRTMAMIGCKARKFVCYPIAVANGQAMVNWIADLQFPADHEWAREDWNRKGAPSDLLPHFGGWSFDWLDVPTLIRNAEAIYEWPMVDRDPLPRWTHGRMTLLGDAAHPMYPIGSNGASQAILDARVLARSLRDHGQGAAALELYEAERRPATAAIVTANRGDGPDKVLDIVEARAPHGFGHLSDVISQGELQDIAAHYKGLAGMDVERLNGAPDIL